MGKRNFLHIFTYEKANEPCGLCHLLFVCLQMLMNRLSVDSVGQSQIVFHFYTCYSDMQIQTKPDACDHVRKVLQQTRVLVRVVQRNSQNTRLYASLASAFLSCR